MPWGHTVTSTPPSLGWETSCVADPLRDLQCPLDTLLARSGIHTHNMCAHIHLQGFLWLLISVLRFCFWRGQVAQQESVSRGPSDWWLWSHTAALILLPNVQWGPAWRKEQR